ncbi:prevent-host-death protein [Methylovulum psychrotolerans]|uniref:Prevent-host-death protein n=1 Tax=Methylovulum psychrotolerans TaxID=1704499 RepID=A0A1Z4C210_9GAMM|nr:prevent-host-death protein [Methylovulum psychrotolerans]ASF47572.1 prevent-host-death protein [Methylovulum psychrotolerans]MBT9099912.1 hypothetical protein [Methylovulum psychrotolerans]
MVTIRPTEQQKPLKQQDTVTQNGCGSAIRLSAAEDPQLRKYTRQVLSLDDFTQADIQAILTSESPVEALAFNAEYPESPSSLQVIESEAYHAAYKRIS